jgi:LysM repeat protein
MQSFYFSTGLGAPTCNEAPNSVTVQSPKNINVDLSVNGLDVRIGSTITFQNATQDEIKVTVIDGELDLVTGETVNEGETLMAMTDEDGNIIEILDIVPSDEDQQETNDAILNVFNTIIPPDETEEDNPPDDSGETIHIVVLGDTLFSIGQLYNASLPAIIARNNLGNDSVIFVGQRLVIPNPGSGFVGLPTSTGADVDPAIDLPGSGVVDCGGFRPTSPLGGLAYGDNVFFWDAATGADHYRVNVFNNAEGKSVSFETLGSETTLTGALVQGNIGGGFDFGWQVQALNADGSVACTSGTVTLARGAAPPIVVVPGFTVTWGCAGTGLVTFVWSGAKAGEALTFVYFDDYFFGVPQTFVGTGPSGSSTMGNGIFSVLFSAATATGPMSGTANATPASMTC